MTRRLLDGLGYLCVCQGSELEESQSLLQMWVDAIDAVPLEKATVQVGTTTTTTRATDIHSLPPLSHLALVCVVAKSVRTSSQSYSTCCWRRPVSPFRPPAAVMDQALALACCQDGGVLSRLVGIKDKASANHGRLARVLARAAGGVAGQGKKEEGGGDDEEDEEAEQQQDDENDGENTEAPEEGAAGGATGAKSVVEPKAVLDLLREGEEFRRDIRRYHGRPSDHSITPPVALDPSLPLSPSRALPACQHDAAAALVLPAALLLRAARRARRGQAAGAAAAELRGHGPPLGLLRQGGAGTTHHTQTDKPHGVFRRQFEFACMLLIILEPDLYADIRTPFGARLPHCLGGACDASC